MKEENKMEAALRNARVEKVVSFGDIVEIDVERGKFGYLPEGVKFSDDSRQQIHTVGWPRWFASIHDGRVTAFRLMRGGKVTHRAEFILQGGRGTLALQLKPDSSVLDWAATLRSVAKQKFCDRYNIVEIRRGNPNQTLRYHSSEVAGVSLLTDGCSMATVGPGGANIAKITGATWAIYDLPGCGKVLITELPVSDWRKMIKPAKGGLVVL